MLPNSLSDSRRPIMIVLLATLAVYARSFTAGFVWDDGPALIHNPLFNPPTPHTLGFFWTHPSWNLYQPLTCTLWAACARAGYIATADENGVHLSALPFHLLNVALHLVATAGVYQLLRTLKFENVWAAAGAAIFGLDPIQVEAAGFIGALNTPLYGCLAVYALMLYVRAASRADESDKRAGQGDHVSTAGVVGDPSRARRSTVVRSLDYSVATALFVLAMLAQPVALVVSAVAVVLDRLGNQRSWRAIFSSAWPWFVLAMPFAILTKLNQHGVSAAATSPVWSRPLIALDNLAWQTLHACWPVGLTVDYGRSPAMLLAHPTRLLCGLLTLALAVLALRLRTRRPLTTAGFAFAAIALLPSSGIVPFDFEEFSAVADRHAYFAVIGFALVIVDTLRRLPAKPARMGMAAALALFAGLTFGQLGFWQNDVTLFDRGVSLNPRSWLCEENLAAAQMVSNPRAAMDHFAKAIAIHPSNVGTYDNFAMSALNAGDPGAAMRKLNEGLRIAPNNAGLHDRLADAFDRLGRHDQASVERAAARRPVAHIDTPP